MSDTTLDKDIRKEIRESFEIIDNYSISRNTWWMKLQGNTSLFSAPGQFVNVAIEGKYLRRPISVSDCYDDKLVLVYDVVGEGTQWMSRQMPGKKLDILVALGNGFNVNVDCKRPLLIGGGIGNAPLVGLAKALVAVGKRPVVVLGFASADIVSLDDCFQACGIDTYIATVDGSRGTKGFVTDAIAANNLDYDYFYACGPTPMLKALCQGLDVPGEVSLESRMGCGFGACVCCSVMTVDGARRICKDGPVFRKEELIWK